MRADRIGWPRLWLGSFPRFCGNAGRAASVRFHAVQALIIQALIIQVFIIQVFAVQVSIGG
jgi:hypothetical protein